MRKLLSVLLSIILVMVILPIGVFNTPVSAETSGIYTYTVSNGEVTITRCDSSISGDITIPSTLGGYSVTSIGECAFKNCRSLKSVTIPDSVKSIGDYAFEDCSSLTSVTIPNSVTSIGNYAFYNCDLLESITIPNSVTSIGGFAFFNTAYYNNISNWENNVLYIGCHLTGAKTSISGSYIIKNGTKTIADYAFIYCTSLTSVTLPDSVTSIGEYAFKDCDSLISVTIPNSVTNIGEYAFWYCTSLTSVTIPNGVTSIGANTFAHCSLLKSVTIGNGVTSIDYGAFSYCESLKSVIIPDSVTSIGIGAFQYCSSLTSVTLPDSVTSIGFSAFSDTAFYKNSSNWENKVLYIGCHLIDAKSNISGSYIIKSGTKTLADDAFYSCSSLTSIIIPDSVISIGDDAFSNCHSLESVTIHDGVTSISDDAFFNCCSLKSVTIPDSVTSICRNAFSYCDLLESVYYCGTKEQWNQIGINDGNEKLTSANIRYNFNQPSVKIMVLKTSLLHNEKEMLFDYNFDGEIDIRDLIALKEKLAG